MAFLTPLITIKNNKNKGGKEREREERERGREEGDKRHTALKEEMEATMRDLSKAQVPSSPV